MAPPCPRCLISMVNPLTANICAHLLCLTELICFLKIFSCLTEEDNAEFKNRVDGTRSKMTLTPEFDAFTLT